MRCAFVAALFALTLALLPAPPCAAQPMAPKEPPPAPDTPRVPGEGAVGTWFGVLEAGPTRLRTILDVATRGDGLLVTLESVDQGGATFVADRAAFDPESGVLTFAVDRLGASYRGTLADEGSRLEGVWTQGAAGLPLLLHRRAERWAPSRPQTPESGGTYSSHDLTFSGGSEVELAGTLVVPRGPGPFPAVVFASGSGPQDRDETILGHKPFLVLADHLARHGIASLRYDDRGVGGSGGDHYGSTVADFADDLTAAVRVLRARPEVTDRAVGVVGHSEGGLSALKAAAGGAPVDFLVLLAGPGVPMRELIPQQTRDLMAARGVDAAMIEKMAAYQAEDLALLAREGASPEALRRELRSRFEDRDGALALPPVQIESQVEGNTSPWALSLIREDPSVYLPKVKVPVLALYGGRDLQVAAGPNADALRKGFARAEHGAYQVRTLPGLNHLFQRAETGLPSEYGAIEETLAPEALEAVTQWIAEHTGRPDSERPAPDTGR